MISRPPIVAVLALGMTGAIAHAQVYELTTEPDGPTVISACKAEDTTLQDVEAKLSASHSHVLSDHAVSGHPSHGRTADFAQSSMFTTSLPECRSMLRVALAHGYRTTAKTKY